MAENLVEWQHGKTSILGVFQGYNPNFRRWMVNVGGVWSSNGQGGTFLPRNLLKQTFNQDKNNRYKMQETQNKKAQLKSILKQVKESYREREEKILSFFSDNNNAKQGLENFQQLWEGNYQDKQTNDIEQIKENIIIEIEELLTNKVEFLMEEEIFYQALLKAGNTTLCIGNQEITLNDEDYKIIRAFNEPEGSKSASSWFYIVEKNKTFQKEERISKTGRKISHFSFQDKEQLKSADAIYQAIKKEVESEKIKVEITTKISMAELNDILGKEGESLENQIVNFLKTVMIRTETWKSISPKDKNEIGNIIKPFFEKVAEKFAKTKTKNIDIKKYWAINNNRLEISQNRNFQGFSGELQNIIASLRISKKMLNENKKGIFIKSIDFINTGQLTSYFGQYNQDTLVKIKYEKDKNEDSFSFGMQMKNPFERNIENNSYTAYKNKEYKIKKEPHDTLIKYLEIKNWDYFLQVVLNTVDNPQEFEYFLYTFFENFMRLQADKIADENLEFLAYTDKLKDWEAELKNGTIFTDFYLVNRKIVPAYTIIDKLIKKVDISINDNEIFSLRYTPPPITAENGKAERLETSTNLLGNASITVKTVIPLD